MGRSLLLTLFGLLSAFRLVAGDGRAAGETPQGGAALRYGPKRAVRDTLPTSQRFLPTSRRIDRGIDDIRFVYKGEMALGLSVSYATLTSDDSDFMLLLDGIDLKGSIFTINPSFGYFVRDNLCVGARFGYSRTEGTLDNVSLNLGSANDLNMSLSGVALQNRMTTVAAFVRSYAGLDRKGHFGLFAELELAYKMGASLFRYGTGEQAKQVHGNTLQAKVALNTGVAVYIFPNVCCTLSFGLGGLQYNKITQRDGEGLRTGGRQASKMLFRLNLADIRIGFNIHI